MNRPVLLSGSTESLPSPASNFLVSEAHHRLGNSLALLTSILRMQGRSLLKHGDAVPAADVRLLVAEMGQRLEAVGRLHRRLRHADGPMDVADYLRETVGSAVAELAFAGDMRLQFDMASPCVVAAGTAPLIGLAVNELVMNAIKFAHPSGVAGHLIVGCDAREGSIVIDVIDDGVGFPEGFDPATGGGFGLQLVRSLAAQMKAQLTLADTGMGVHAQLRIPK